MHSLQHRAARNIMHVGLWLLAGLPHRPPVLRTKAQQPQPQQQAQQAMEHQGLEPHQIEAEQALNDPANYVQG